MKHKLRILCPVGTVPESHSLHYYYIYQFILVWNPIMVSFRDKENYNFDENAERRL